MAEMTCPRCRKQYYGVGCPACDDPAVAPGPVITPTPAKKKKSPALVLIGVPFFAYAVYAAAKGQLTLGNDNDDEIVRAVEEPKRFWGLVAALAFAGLVFIIVGFTYGGFDEV